MKSLRFLTLIIFGIILITSLTFTQEKMKEEMKMEEESMNDDMMKEKIITEINTDENGVAINGYDPVAYFTEMKPAAGKREYSYKWMEAEWYFSNNEHLQMFKENPEMYLPQYGGFCAFGIAKDHKSKADPEVWQIIDGKLYLYTNDEVCSIWKENSKENIEHADMNWQEEK